MTRRIVGLGADSRFAVCDDGEVFFWTGQKWEPWGRPPIPQPMPTTATEVLRRFADPDPPAPAPPPAPPPGYRKPNEGPNSPGATSFPRDNRKGGRP